MTFLNMESIEKLISEIDSQVVKRRALDSQGIPLNSTYQNNWNFFNKIELKDLNPLLKAIIIFSEDKNFYQHKGLDWLARFNAAALNVRSMKKKRGASTISEQVVRIVYPRRRTIWSRWMEGWEAISLEKKISKSAILEFYVNQVPFSSNRRGFVEAAEFYFDRDISNLNLKEMLFLVININSPSFLNPYRNPNSKKFYEKKIMSLADRLLVAGIIDSSQFDEVIRTQLAFSQKNNYLDNRHFLNFIKDKRNGESKFIRTRLDSELQWYINKITTNHLKYLDGNGYNVKNAGVLVIDRNNMRIISYNSITLDPEKFGDIDCVQTSRKSGSTLKPFLYAMGLENGLTLASTIRDEPMSQVISSGIHDFLNASHKFYGDVSLREALANSLNIPSIKLLNFVGIRAFYDLLTENLGFHSIKNIANSYNLGLAVGAAEVTLFELVQASAVFANKGVFREIESSESRPRRVFDEKTVSLINSVLFDKLGRRFEFTRDSIFNFNENIAVKTGTSTNFKDAWVVGYSDDYVVGIWFGNLDYSSMNFVSGAMGPGIVLRGIFSRLNREGELKALKIDRNLIKRRVDNYEEYFVNDDGSRSARLEDLIGCDLNLKTPLNGSQILIDPRIPLDDQKLHLDFSFSSKYKLESVEIDSEKVNDMLWSLKRGKHKLVLRFTDQNGNFVERDSIFFCY